MLQSIIDPQLDRGTADNQVFVWDNTTKRFVPSVSLSGLTLNSPVIAGDFSWTGEDAVWDCSDEDKTVLINATGDFVFRTTSSRPWIEISPGDNKISFGNLNDNPTYPFLGTGTVSIGGDLDVTGNITTGQYIGDVDDPMLIEVDGANGAVIIDGGLTVNTSLDSTRVLDVLGEAGIAGSDGQWIELVSGQGGDLGVGVGITAGDGGNIKITSGDGGEASGTPIFGGAGGKAGGFQFFGANGGNSIVTAGTSNGGIGGSFGLESGDGGDSTGVTSGASTGGGGGSLNVSAGDGGDAANSSASNTGGEGGNVIFNAGIGGTGATANGTDGNIYLGGTTGNVRIGDRTVPTDKLEHLNNSVAINGGEKRFNIVGNANYVGLKAGATADDTTYALPVADGTTDDILKTDGSGVMAWTTPTVSTQISFSMYDPEPARGSETSLDGAFIPLATAQPLDSVPTNVVVSTGTGKIVVVVNAGSDFAGEITVTGTSVDRDTGATTGSDTDTLTIDALTTDGSDTDSNGNIRHAFTGAYITSKWFTGTVTLSTADLTLTDVDVYHVSFEQFDDTPNVTLDTFNATILTTNVAAEFDSYIYVVMVTGDKCNITREASLNVGADGETAIANRYWRLRRGNINKAIDGITDGVWVDIHYSNSPAYVEDVSVKIWATEIIPLTLP